MVLSRETRISAFYTNIEVWHKIVCIFWAEYTKIRGKSLAKVRAAASQLARVFHVGVFLENADASLAVACLCANISGATAQRRLRVAGIQGGIRPLGAFSWFVLCRAAKNEHNSRTANAHEVQCERQKEKTLKIPSPTRGRDSFRGFSPPQGQNKKAITFVIAHNPQTKNQKFEAPGFEPRSRAQRESHKESLAGFRPPRAERGRDSFRGFSPHTEPKQKGNHFSQTC